MKAPLQNGLILLFALLFASGCAIGPDYRKPAISAPGQFRGGPSPADTNSIAELHWWDLYQDPTLSELIRVALTNNYDVRIAATRVEQALQAAHQTRAQFFPSAAYDGEVSRGRNSFLGNPSPGRGSTGDGILAATSAFWEVDLWGRIRRLNESARAQFLASEEARQGVRLSLVSSVAEGYFQLLTLDLELEIATRTTNAFSETARMFRAQKEQGIASQLDVARAEGALTSSAATIPRIGTANRDHRKPD